MANASHTIREEIHGIVLFVGGIWAAFLLTLVFPSLDSWGIVPRTPVGLVGIAAARLPPRQCASPAQQYDSAPRLVDAAGRIQSEVLGDSGRRGPSRRPAAVGIRPECNPHWSQRSDLRADRLLDHLGNHGEANRAAHGHRGRGLSLRWHAAVGHSPSIRFPDLLGRTPLRRHCRRNCGLCPDARADARRTVVSLSGEPGAVSSNGRNSGCPGIRRGSCDCHKKSLRNGAGSGQQPSGSGIIVQEYLESPALGGNSSNGE